MIGEEIRRRRQEKGLTGVQLAAKAGMAPSAISQIETGRRSPLSASVMKLAAALECEVADLYPKAPQPPLPLKELPEEVRAQLDERGFSEPYFVPLEEGEEEDTVTLQIYWVRLLNGDEPILQAMREASAEEVIKMRQQLEKSGRYRK
jgi:transcriptional regulator with XRE-family HTH domain